MKKIMFFAILAVIGALALTEGMCACIFGGSASLSSQSDRVMFDRSPSINQEVENENPSD